MQMIFWSTNMMSRLVGYFLLISLLIISLVAGAAYHLGRKDLSASAFGRLEVAAEYKTEQIKYWLNNQRRESLLIAANPLVISYADDLPNPGENGSKLPKAHPALKKLLKAFVVNKPDLRDIFLITAPDGFITLSTDSSMEGEYRADDQFFIQGRYSTFIQKVHLSPTTLEPIMTVATPLLNAEGQKLGVVGIDLDLERMDRIILKRTGLGQTGEAYLVDKLNVLVSASRLDRENLTRGVHSPAIEAAIRGEPCPGLYKNYRGIPVIGVFRWIEDLDLALLVEMHQKEAFEPAGQLAWTIVLLGLGAILLLGGGGFLLARRITRPILDISQAVSLMASGDLGARAR